MPVDQKALASTLQSLMAMTDVPRGPNGRVAAEHLERVLDAARGVLRVDGVGLMLTDEHDRLAVVGTSDAVSTALEQGQQHLGVGPALDCVRSGATVLVPDLADATAYTALCTWLAATATPVRAVLSAPVRVAGRVAGTLNALRTEPEEWTAEHVRAVEAYAGIIGRLLQLTAAHVDVPDGQRE